MTRPRTANPNDILDAAADLFAASHFHEVRLEDIAAKAGVGKGTVYLYWKSKEEVYLAIIRRGFAAVLARIERDLQTDTLTSSNGTWQNIETIIAAIVEFAFTYPGVYRIMRSGVVKAEDDELQQTREALVGKITDVLSCGVASGELADTCPSLTAQYILSFVRGALLYSPPGLTPEILAAHMTGLLRHGISPGVSR